MHNFGKLLLVSILLASIHAHGACFDPPNDLNPTDPAPWGQLTRYMGMATPGTGVKQFLTLSKGVGEFVNRDYYRLSFKKHPTKSADALFKELRLAFHDFARGNGKTGLWDFLPYGIDTERAKNEELWMKDQPTGAVMTFLLGGLTGGTEPGGQRAGRLFSVSLRPGGVAVVGKNGDVQVTCSSSRDFIVTTVETSANSFHPVAGHRGFGLKEGPNDTWTFYTMAIDRNSPSWIRQVTPGKTLFELGHLFWKHFFGNMADYLAAQGLKPGDLEKNNPSVFPCDSQSCPK